MTYDAILIGAGHNGLTCGAYLARAGLRTLVLERRSIIGGAAVTEEIHPGFRASRFSYIMGHVHPKVSAELELERFGLEHLKVPDVVYPLYDDCMTFTSDMQRNLDQIRRYSKRDAKAYPLFFEAMSDSIQVMRELMLQTPIDPARRNWKTLKETLALLWRHRKIGRQFYRLTDALTKSAYDYVAEWFESDVVRAVLCYWATIGSNSSPRSGGTAYNILFHLVGENGMGFARGGMGSISQAIADSGKRHGMAIRTNATVVEILVKSGRSVGVVLENGEEITGRAVISNASAHVTFGQLIGSDELPDEFLKDLGRFRSTGNAFKINLAVDRPPRYRGFDPAIAGVDVASYAHIGPSTDYLEEAFDDAKYGRYSRHPYISPITPSLVDPSLAPEGKHVVTLYGGCAPYQLRGTTWEQEKDRFVQQVFNTMDEFAPGFSDSVIAVDAMVPPDIERILNIPGGHELHGDCAVDQLFMNRPVAGFADYRSPVRGLYQCGASTHPGGAVSCVPGHNAAREILADWRRKRLQ